MSLRTGQHLTPDARQRAWAADNLATDLASGGSYAEAVRLHEIAKKYWLSEEGNGPWSGILKRSMAATLLWAGDAVRARELVEEVVEEMDGDESINWATAAKSVLSLPYLRLDRRC